MQDDDRDRDSSKEEASQSLKKMKIVFVSVILVIIVGIFGGMFINDSFVEKSGGLRNFFGDEAAERLYWPLKPSFVLNFEGKSKARYMKIGLEVATSSNKAYVAIKKHMPVIRNEIVLLLSGQKYEEMVTPEGKEQLRAELIETINNILKQHKVKNGIDSIYFTSFVMQ